MRTPSRLVEELRQLGVGPGDLVMVHASLRRLGPVEGGVSGVLDALDAAVGPDGTLMMTLGADDAEPFDAAHTPAQADVGYLAEAFRRRPGTRVSDHPEGRFGARGRRAEEVLADPPWNDYYGPGSPLDHAVRLGVRVLRLGADLNTVTLLHLAEYLVELPSKRRVRRSPRVRGPQGPEVRVVDCLDDEHGIVDLGGEDYFARLLEDYLAQGRARTGLVGQAHSELIEGADLVSFGVRWMARHLDVSGPAGS
ncbi:aminoglycoside N(3)-acetyltransferase [Melittangium boletus]|uniref:aminoglycoside N(3)-acetyltransferase n=1 Tax=Melittangium boletus TaxID=83453 RepID=UPI003DA4DF6D